MRSSWQIDLKWMLGLAACALIVVSGALFSLSQLTQRSTAVPVASALVSAGINDRVSDEEYAQIQAAAAASPATSITMSPIALSFTGAEIAGLDKAQASAVVGGKLAGVMYDNGEGAAKSLIVTPPAESGQEPVKLGPVGSLTAANHDMFTQFFIGAAALALFALGGVAFLARGWGRLGAPSFILSVGAAPLAVVWTLAKSAVGTGDPGESLFAQNARAAFTGAAGDLSTVFLAVAAVSLAAGVICVIGSAASLAVARSAGAAEPPAEEPAPEPAPAPAPKRAEPTYTGPLRASASLAATTYRVSGPSPASSNAEASNSKQNVA